MLLKRLFDILASFLGLLILWPVLLVVAVLIKIKMPGGPVFFRQQRVGRHGNLFTLVKFRTMSMGHSGSTVSVKGESRITPIGSTLRKYKLDELPAPVKCVTYFTGPELWNVLKGDMSFVGPLSREIFILFQRGRPDVPGYADKLTGEQRKILELRPGITGLSR